MKIRTKQMILCGLFAALVAVGAWIRIPMPYFDYITLQTLFVLLAGMLLGAKTGAFALGIYLLVGLCGVPVFAGGGGFDYVLRPSFGFLLGFVAAAALIGFLAERKKAPDFKTLLLAGLAGLAVIYGLGILYRYLILNFYLGTPLSLWLIFLACLPAELPKDILIAIAAAGLAGRLRAAVTVKTNV